MYVWALPWTLARLVMCWVSVSNDPMNFCSAVSPTELTLLRSTPGNVCPAFCAVIPSGHPELNCNARMPEGKG